MSSSARERKKKSELAGRPTHDSMHFHIIAGDADADVCGGPGASGAGDGDGDRRVCVRVKAYGLARDIAVPESDRSLLDDRNHMPDRLSVQHRVYLEDVEYEDQSVIHAEAYSMTRRMPPGTFAMTDGS